MKKVTSIIPYMRIWIILTIITCNYGIAQHSFCKNDFTFKKNKSANKALKFWGEYLIKIDSIEFIAVIKNEKCNHYEFSAGGSTNFNIRSYLEGSFGKLSIYQKINLIKTAPKKIRKILFKNRKSVTPKFDSINDQFKINKVYSDKFFIDSLSPKGNKSKVLYSGIEIGNTIFPAGTLGAVFSLKGFPDAYFGLSNSHVLGGSAINLGDNIMHPGIGTKNPNDTKNHVGKLFWDCLDLQREAAIVHFDTSKFKKIGKTNKCKDTINQKLGKPQLNESVKICGKGNQSSIDNLKIYSTNAIIKESSSFSSEIPFFTEQILILGTSPSGNSGSCILNKNNQIIGLVFANNTDKTYTVANNINNIFNHRFNQPQEIKFKGKTSPIKKLKVNYIYN